MSTAAPAKAEILVRTTLSELATPTAENLSLQARSALQAKLAEYPQSNKPTGQASEAGSGVKSQTQSSTKCVVISPLVPGTVPPSSTLTPADLTSPSSAPVAAALGDTGKPKLNGTEGGVKSDQKKAEESSESSTTSSESSSSSESDGEKKKKAAEVINTPPPAKRKRGRPPKSAQSSIAGPTVHSTGRTPKTPKSTPRRRPPPPLVSVTPDVKTSRQRGRGCGNCPGCLRDDCGKCPYCLDKPKFGGPGVKKQRCSLRVCSNFVAAPGVRNPKHSLNLSAATSAAANAKAVEKKPLMTPKTVPVKELDKDKSIPIIVPTKELKDTPRATPTTTAVVVTVPAASPSKNKKGELKMRCIQCGRERKQSMARSEKFCTQRCILQWLEDNPDRSLDDALTEAIKTGDDTPPATSSEEVQKKPTFSRVLKNLQIDMALPGTTLTAAEGEISPPPTTNPLSPPTLAPSPKPVPSTTIIRTRKQAGEALKTLQSAATTGKKTDTPPAAGVKRATQQQPASVKRPKQDFMSVASLPPSLTTMAGSTATTKSVSFDLATTTIPVSTVQPISAPPLSRTIQPPSISIVPLDQLTALGTALLNQQKQQKQQKSEIPTGLPSDIREWSIDQVVAYFQGTSDCKDYADIFREQEVDGTALLLLSHESLVKCLGIKLGRALKIMLHVEELRKQHEVLQYNM